MKPLTKPLVYEVWTGYGDERRKVEVTSRARAISVFNELRDAGERPALYLGNLFLRGEQ